MIKDLVRQWFFRKITKYILAVIILRRITHVLICDWMRQSREKVLEQFLEKEDCRTEIITELMFVDLVESSSG